MGLTYSWPDFRPRVCTRTIGAQSLGPPTWPPFARNSSMTFWFQLFGSLISRPCQIVLRLGQWPPGALNSTGPAYLPRRWERGRRGLDGGRLRLQHHGMAAIRA